MCYNCGCGLREDDMGQGHALSQPNGKSITDQTFDELAKKWNTDADGARKLVYGLLTGTEHDEEKEHFMDHLYHEAAHSQGMTEEEAKNEAIKLLKNVLNVQ